METERCPFNGVDCEYIPLAKKSAEQADEIERLREDVSVLEIYIKEITEVITARNDEIERLREALKRNQRPEGEALNGVIEWIKSDPQRFDMALFKLQQKDGE